MATIISRRVGILQRYASMSAYSRHAAYSSHPDDRRTKLYDFHVKQGARMVPFGGWTMPVQYKDSLIESHLNVREHVGIFDVSHMLQTRVHGKDAVKFIESLIVGDIEALNDNQGTLTLFTNKQGCILDDLIVNKTNEGYLYIVSNAGCMDQDFALMKNRADVCKAKGMDVSFEHFDQSLIAVQGPGMTKALQPGLKFDLADLPFMTNAKASVFGVDGCRVTRCGYTGEDGVEISIPHEKVQFICEALLESKVEDVRMVGLGARDTLRLEAGLCLYGNDIDQTTTPVESSLLWTVGKRRREAEDFPGASVINRQAKAKPTRKRVGFISTGAPARGGTVILNETGEKKIGHLTSGCPSPSLKVNISMGYVELPFAKNGTKVKFEIRKKIVDAVVSKMPFVPAKYYFGKK